MARKKSARSKGYRKTVEKKPYLSKKEIIILVCIVAVIAIGLFLFNRFYDDGSLKVVSGAVQVSGENSLVINTGTGNSPKYYKLGQTAPLEGYTLTSKPINTDENVVAYTYEPEDASSAIDSVSVNGVVSPASNFASYVASYYSGYPQVEVSEVQTKTVGEHEVYWLTARAFPEVAEEAADAPGEAADEAAGAADAAVEETADAAGDAVEEAAGAAEAAVGEAADAAGEVVEEAAGAAESAVEEAADAAGDAVEEAADAAEGAVEETADAAGEAAEAAGDAPEETEVADETAPVYQEELYAYVAVGERAIGIHVLNNAESTDEYIGDESLVALMDQVIAGLSYETK